MKSRHFCQFEWFLPTFCQDNEVKPWKSLENYQIYRSFDETEEERTKEAVFGRNSQKLTKSAKKIGKRCSSQKSWNFIAGDERPGQTLRFEPQQALLWQIWPKSPKKCQMRKFPKKNFFQSSKKGLKRWKKWLRSQRKRFRRGEIAVRWRKKKNKKFFWDFNGPNGHEGAPNLPIRQHFLSSSSKSFYSKSGVGFADFSKFHRFVPEDGFKTTFLVTKRSWAKTLPPWNVLKFLILRLIYSEDGRIQRSFLDLGTF